MKALVIAERSTAAVELAAGARRMADQVVLVTFGKVPSQPAADKVLNITVEEGYTLDNAAETVISVFESETPDCVLVEPTRHMKVIAGRLAAHAGVSVVTDVIEFGEQGAKSLYFGGIAERVVKPCGSVSIYTVASGTFAEAAGQGANVVEEVSWVAPANPIKLVSSTPIQKSGVDLIKAPAVVAAGRGFTEESQLDWANELASKLGGGVACSRPLTEGVNWLPQELYVGVSGLMLTPKAYVAIGISGQMQHMVGCNRSEKVFAINKDKGAPIFNQCDYGLVGDIKDILPAINAAL